DGVLHVPADLPYVLEQAADEPRSRAPYPRIARIYDHSIGRAGGDVAVRRISWLPAESCPVGRHSWRDESLRGLSGAGIRERGSGVCEGRAGTTRRRNKRRRKV